MFRDQMTSYVTPPFMPQGFAFQGTHPPPPHHHHEDGSTRQPHTGVPLAPSLLPTDPQGFRGAAAMLGKRSMPFLTGPGGMEACCEELNMEDELSDDGSASGERKKRLNVEQVRALERSFEMGNKLEPERKMQLAGALGLQPRQIAIWFQNKRARWKTKQLEKDYDALKMRLEELKAENDVLQAQNKRLHAEIMSLRGIEASEPINLNKETEGSCSNRSDNSSDINLDISRAPTGDSPLNHQIQGRIFFPSYRPAVTSQFLESFPRPPEAQCPNKVEHGVQDENFCNMFCAADDQSAAFWAWSEQHNFH